MLLSVDVADAVFFLGARCQSGVRTSKRRGHWHSKAVEGRNVSRSCGRPTEEEDRKANCAELVAAKKEEIATLTATIETKLTRQGDLPE